MRRGAAAGLGLLLLASSKRTRVAGGPHQLERAAEPLAVGGILDLALAERGGRRIRQHEHVLLERDGAGVRQQRGQHLAALALAHALQHRRPQRLQLGGRAAAGVPALTGPARFRGRRRARSVGAGVTRGSSRRAGGAPRASLLQALDPRQQRLDRRVGAGRAAFSSATSSCVRGSDPSFTGCDRVRQQVDRAHRVGLRQVAGLGLEPWHLVGGHAEGVGRLAQGLHHDQMAEVRRSGRA